MRSIVAVLLLIAVAGSRAKNIKIIGGRECRPHSQPWQVFTSRDNGNRWCGASLISDRWAVSAAHCSLPASRLTLHLGDHNLLTNEGTEQRIRAEKVFPHPQYNPSTYDNDFMLIKLSQPAVFNERVKAIPLATTCSKGGQRCLVSGWGNQATNGENYANLLQCLDVPVIARSQCEASYPGKITRNMLCAGFLEGGRDACQFDSGGPLVCNGKLQGVVSWGAGCAAPGFPGVYAEVCRYTNWVKEIIAKN